MASEGEINWEPDSIHLVASRSDLVATNTEEILQSLRNINSSKENALRFRGSVDIGVHGYNDDDRELYEIPEVCRFYELLTTQFPYLFFFLNLQLPTLKAIAFCVCGARLVGNGRVEVNNGKLSTFLQSQFSGLNALFQDYGLDDDYPNLNREISEEIFRYFEM